MKIDIKIKPLNKEKLNEVCALADRVFAGDVWMPHGEKKGVRYLFQVAKTG
jgi:hypothetical protein